MAKELLQIEDLKTYFYTWAGVVKAVDGVSLKINEGETLGKRAQENLTDAIQTCSTLGVGDTHHLSRRACLARPPAIIPSLALEIEMAGAVYRTHRTLVDRGGDPPGCQDWSPGIYRSRHGCGDR